MSQLDGLKRQLAAKEAQLLEVKLELIESKLSALQQNDIDKEARLRAVETSRTRFETLAWLTFGGGALSLASLIALALRPH